MRNTFQNAIKSLFLNPRHFVFAIYHRLAFLIKDDRKYLQIYYRLGTGDKLNLDNPVTFNEKLQWLKLYNRQDIYTTMVDKLLVKEYVAKLIGKEYIVPLIAVYDSPSEINWEELPNQFVIKTNHDGGSNGIIVCKDKSIINKDKALYELQRSYKRNSYLTGREWPYKNVKKKIIVEKYLVNSETNDLKDYKFFCFNGEVKLVEIATDRGLKTGTKFNYFDSDFHPINMTHGHKSSEKKIERPFSFEKMKEFASKLSDGIPHVRIDFYEVDKHLYFGEFTFFDAGGIDPFEPIEWNKKLGTYIQLPYKKI